MLLQCEQERTEAPVFTLLPSPIRDKSVPFSSVNQICSVRFLKKASTCLPPSHQPNPKEPSFVPAEHMAAMTAVISAMTKKKGSPSRSTQLILPLHYLFLNLSWVFFFFQLRKEGRGLNGATGFLLTQCGCALQLFVAVGLFLLTLHTVGTNQRKCRAKDAQRK